MKYNLLRRLNMLLYMPKGMADTVYNAIYGENPSWKDAILLFCYTPLLMIIIPILILFKKDGDL